jgi:thiol-disulfide isomerase/thioredoxin
VAVSRKAWVRGGAIAALALLVALALRPSPSARRAVVATATAAPAAPRVTAHGFVLTSAAELKERMRRSTAKGIVVDIWASWCGSCREELPLLFRVKNEFAGAIEVWLVSVDEADGEPAAKEMLDSLYPGGQSFIVDEPLENFKAGMTPKWPGMLPASFLFDHDARLHYFWGGTVYENEITPLLHRYLTGENIDGEADFGLAPGKTTR